MTAPTAAKLSFKEQMLLAREDAIIRAVNQLLAEKGFDAMTVDEVAATVGIAKASLYKHFASKEDLAAAAMVRVMRQALEFVQLLPPDQAPLEQLRSMARWALQRQLAGEMPALPSQNSSLRRTLLANRDYLDSLLLLSEHLGGWITAAQAAGTLDPQLPPILVLYTLYARACDPVLQFLKAGGEYGDAQIVDLVLRTCFKGLDAR